SRSSHRSAGSASTTERVERYRCSTRAGSSLEVPRVSVDTEDLLQDLHLLAHAGVRARAFQERGHELGARVALRRDRGLAQSRHRLAPAAGVARPAHLREALHLAPLDLGIDLEERDRGLPLRGVRVDPDDELLLPLDLLLEAEGRLGDLALGIPALDRLDHAAHRLDL